MYAKPLTGAKYFAENIKKCPYSPRFTVLFKAKIPFVLA